MTPINLGELKNWICYEMKYGNRVTASKLYKIFCKYAKIQFPKVTTQCLEDFEEYSWTK